MTGAEYYEDGGFMFFLSGATSGEARTFAGVGFIVAPWAAGSIVSFKAVSERVASLRVKVTGGILTILNVYVPHDRHALDERHAVFADLSKEMKVKRQHCSTIVARCVLDELEATMIFLLIFTKCRRTTRKEWWNC